MRRTLTSRTVFASYGGVNIVRSATKWYLEPADTTLPRQRITIEEAIQHAIDGHLFANGAVTYGLPGGRFFDQRVRQEIARWTIAKRAQRE